MRSGTKDHPSILVVEQDPIMRVGHLVVRILLHERNDPLADGLPAVHHAEYMLHGCAVLGEQVSERVVVCRRRALVRANREMLESPSELVNRVYRHRRMSALP